MILDLAPLGEGGSNSSPVMIKASVGRHAREWLARSAQLVTDLEEPGTRPSTRGS
jgi:hypothetical protein